MQIYLRLSLIVASLNWLLNPSENNCLNVILTLLDLMNVSLGPEVLRRIRESGKNFRRTTRQDTAP
jgi:hypothetical protein